MTLDLSASLAAHLENEVVTLATLWEITREDGTVYRYTDHDTDIVFEGQTYSAGVGYDRSALQDKFDFSVDNIDVQGILRAGDISREEIRAGAFDNAEVYLRIVNWKEPGAGSILRRRGWFGEFKQNNLGQFDVELRGLSAPLQSKISRVYSPGCPVDLGSSGFGQCNRILINTPARLPDEFYNVNEEATAAGFLFRCIVEGTTSSDTEPPDDADFNVAIGGIVEDGTAVWERVNLWYREGEITTLNNRRRFSVTLTDAEARLDTYSDWYNGGVLQFLSGANQGLSVEVHQYTKTASAAGDVVLYLRVPNNPALGDTFRIFPGCDKRLVTCKQRFLNIYNYQGYPHVPGDDYLKTYPDPN